MRFIALVLLVVPAIAFAQNKAKSSADIAASVSKATVAVRARLSDGSTMAGSGFIVDPSGTIVTNYHVVKDATYVEVRLASDEVFPVTGTRAVDQWRDIVVMQIPAFSLPVVSLGDSNLARPGDHIMAIGTALGMLENSVTAGIVSGLRDAGGYKVIQMDAAISAGNSGGPVVLEDGTVIGISTFKLKTGESLNFAVPINYVRGLLQLPVTAGLAQLASAEQPRLFADKGEGAGPAEKNSAVAPFPTYWKSLTTGGIKALSMEGDRILIENVLPNDLKRAGATSSVELKRVGDKWVGAHRERVNCRPLPLTRRKLCPVVTLPVTITRLTPELIEGTGEHQLFNAEFNCRACAYAGPAQTQPFTWLPQ